MTAADMEPHTGEQTLQSAKQLFINFQSTLKKLNLYSDTHTLYQDALNQLKMMFENFFQTYGSFKIEIKRDQILFDGQTIHQGDTEATDISNALYRDGILWIDFIPGMDLWEIDTFLRVINKYARLDEDAEDDIVTALWQYNLPSVLYEAIEPSLEGGEDLDFSQFKCRPELSEILMAEGIEAPAEAKAVSHTEPMPAPVVPPLSEKDDLWGLTALEQEQLRKMIAEEERLNGTDYVIEVLLYILEKQVQPDDDLVNLLEILTREMREVLIQGRYGYLARVLHHIKNYIEKLKKQNHFSSIHLERFYLSLATENFLGGLNRTLVHIENAKTSEIKDFKRVLLLLDESLIFTLGPMIDETGSPKIRRLLLEIIGTRARSNFSLLEELIRESAPNVVVHLMRILHFLNSERASQTLRSLIYHESEKVREAALRFICAQDSDSYEEMFRLIDDPDENIRKMALFHMGRKRSTQVEKMLLEYIHSNRDLKKNPELFFDVLRTLGRCGSERSLPFLHDQLFLMPLLGVLRPDGKGFRRAVMAALKELNTKNAAFLAKRASRGFMYNILRPSKLTKKE